MFDNLPWLEKVYFGNTVLAWATAGGSALLAVVAFAAAKFFGVRYFQKRFPNWNAGLAAEIIRRTSLPTYWLLGLYVGLQFVELSARLGRLSDSVAKLALLVQLGLWASAGVKFAVSTWIDADESDLGRRTVGPLLRIVGRALVWVAVLLMSLAAFGVNVNGLVAGLGIGGIAVALAVQNVLGDLLSSLSIALDKPFVVGDFISVGGTSGTVEYIGLKTTRVRAITGEQLVFSNSAMLSGTIQNYRLMEERRVVFRIGVIYSTPVEKLRQVPEMVREIVTRHTAGAGVGAVADGEAGEGGEGVEALGRFDRCHFVELGDFSLIYETVYFVKTNDFLRYRDIQQGINFELMERFHAEGIEFAFPTQTLVVEGIPGVPTFKINA